MSTDLDSFERSLLAELRAEVVARSVGTVPSRRTLPRRRVAAAAAAAALAGAASPRPRCSVGARRTPSAPGPAG